ncbi:DUF5995 family protein [Cryptosporangium aurantiacum]|uniref:Uncharacterized protein n=1 Tax=Cryptosporangium aurantiacum TaxID=134849 RepID=A0A1M7TUR6_9ACTN|nr:DUF5995 family protein [Cryptosporangium aurantiacum]SHN74450.1 hypothetical protein SAMN05443668_10783 [Cryptosporangium aurantiacum]
MAGGIQDVLARMRSLRDTLDPADGVRQFNRVYLRVTEELQPRLSAGFFRDPEFVERFAVLFAGRYFAAVDAGAADVRRVSPAWRPLFAQRTDPRIHPVQFAVAGMNAHINHDLALATVDACLAHGTHPGDERVGVDYLRINAIFEEVEAEIRLALLSGPEELGEPFEPIVHLISTWSVVQARDAAWVRAQVRWALRQQDWLLDRTEEASARATGMTGRHLLTPLLPARRRRAFPDVLPD